MSEIEEYAFLERVDWGAIEPKDAPKELKMAIVKEHIQGLGADRISKNQMVDMDHIVKPVIMGYHRYKNNVNKAVESMQENQAQPRDTVFVDLLNRILPEPKNKAIVTKDNILSKKMKTYRDNRHALTEVLNAQGRTLDKASVLLMQKTIKAGDELYEELEGWLRYV